MRFVFLALIFASGCDQFLPMAEGNLTLSPDADTSGFTALEVHWDSTDGSPSDVQVILAPFTFPEAYLVGGSCCGAGAPSYQLSAWLSRGTQAQPTTAPEDGAPQATQLVVVPDHGGRSDIDLVLAP